MTMAEDPDEIFRSLMEDVDFEEPKGIIDYTKLETIELSRRLNHIKQELFDRKEMMDPRTDEGRDLHSERAAILIELHKRGVM